MSSIPAQAKVRGTLFQNRRKKKRNKKYKKPKNPPQKRQGSDSSCSVPAKHARDPGFNLQYCREKKKDRHQLFKSVILANLEAEVGKITIQGKLGQKSS
jgi:hypothetical protein